MLHSLNWNVNTILFAALIAVPFLGLLLGESRLKRMTFAVFVGIVLAQTLTGLIFHALGRFHLSFASEPKVGLAIFGLTVLLLNMGPLPHHETSKKLGLRIMILSVLLTALLISNVLLFLPDDLKQKAANDSLILAFLNHTRLIWIAAAAGWLIVLNLWPQNDKHKK